MPIYEFYCDSCNVSYNFYSKSVNTTKRPTCPECKRKKLKRQMSTFSRVSAEKEGGASEDLPIDEARMEKALDLLSREAEGINDEDPRQAANLMRKFTDVAGASLGPGMEEALKRMEAGEDPDQVDAEMGDLIDGEEPFIFEGGGRTKGKAKRAAPRKDDTLYEL